MRVGREKSRAPGGLPRPRPSLGGRAEGDGQTQKSFAPILKCRVQKRPEECVNPRGRLFHMKASKLARQLCAAFELVDNAHGLRVMPAFRDVFKIVNAPSLFERTDFDF